YQSTKDPPQSAQAESPESQQYPPESAFSLQISLNSASHKLYYVNYEICLEGAPHRVFQVDASPLRLRNITSGPCYFFAALFCAISYWMNCSIVLSSAPTIRRPFTKIVGVLLTSSETPLARLASIAAAAFELAMHDLKVSAFSPVCPAKSVTLFQAFDAEM